MTLRDQDHRSVVIVGSGMAGLTAAIYTARANLEPLVIRGLAPGGQLGTTTLVENYPGFVQGILGPSLMQNLADQASRFGAELVYGCLTAVDFSQRPLHLTLDDGISLLADAVIVATGASPQWLGLANERRLLGRGVSTCAICDGNFFRDQVVAVIGGGDAALENALTLARFAEKIYLIHRRNRLRASKIMQQKAMGVTKIAFIWNTQVLDVLGDSEVEGLVLKELPTGDISDLEVSGLFLAIGHRPNTAVFRGWLKMDPEGYILTRPGATDTSVEGVFACGDAQDRVYRQAVTAAGAGCMAALDAERWLQQ